MRRTLAATLAAGLLIAGAAACGDDEDGGSEGAAEEGTGAGEEGGSGGGGDFCSTYMGASASQDPEAALQELQDLEPPAEIAAAWDIVVSSDAVTAAELTPEAEEAINVVTTYVMENCTEELDSQVDQLGTTVPGG